MPSLSEIIAWGTSPNVSRIIIAILVGYIILLWISIIIWTTKDIVSRSNNVIYQLVSILLVVIFNLFGLIIYITIRPAKTLIEKFFEDLEYEALSQTTEEKTQSQSKPKKASGRKLENNKSNKKKNKKKKKNNIT
ncbi:hypothetical protein J7J83_02425 [bacterium]|nr:hypothetical protein [bacterium]